MERTVEGDTDTATLMLMLMVTMLVIVVGQFLMIAAQGRSFQVLSVFPRLWRFSPSVAGRLHGLHKALAASPPSLVVRR